jgi:oligopeptide/dipeptide ABC transporter ATP-binding protein
MSSLLSVRDLTVSFTTAQGRLRAVDGVSFDVNAGEMFAIVGESGSGKSVTALAVMGLLPPSGRVDHGDIWFRDRNLLQCAETDLQQVRGREVAMVFQDPLAALNPVHRVGRQIAEVLRIHEDVGRRAARARAVQLLELTGIPEPARRVDAYPHELSGGMRQRVMLAMALACRPALLIADEPTTALDVTVQAQILDLLRSLRDELGLAVVLVTHDLGVVAGVADQVLVMYGGRAVERGTSDEIFYESRHPYTRALVSAVPRLDDDPAGALRGVAGDPPSPLQLPSGCAFHPRCWHATEEPCARVLPRLVPVERGATHVAACHYSDRLDVIDRRGARRG